ncbi:MAG: AAA family ATPase [Ignavibacteriales bacterium]|nr:AAA family ATPase [Ignavibacteriales bacterium]
MKKSRLKQTRTKTALKTARLPKPLSPDRLRWQCDPASLKMRTTDDIRPSREIIGQERALRALRVGLEMEHFGYNIFVTGLPGTGRTTTIKRLLQEFEHRKGNLKDHCYVYNFRNPDMPLALALPAGQGCSLQQDMDSFIKDLLVNIPALYESLRYQEARKTTLQHFQERQKSVLQDFEKRVKEQGFDLVQVQVGNMMRPDVVPVVNGQPVNLDQAEALVDKGEVSKENFEKMRETQGELEKQMAAVFRELRNIERKVQQSIVELEERLVMPLVDEGIEVLKVTYENEKVQLYFAEVREHIRKSLDRFRKHVVLLPQQTEQAEEPEEEEDEFLEYKVNVLVDNSNREAIPIVIETNPKYKNVFGMLEREWEKSGIWKTDFMHIKAGSLLRADGGYLVLNALDVLVEPWAWQDLKRTLRTGKMEIHTYEPTFNFAPSGMKPEAIDLNVKVVMIGDSYLYYLLYERDEDFKKIFKIRADFDSEMPKDKESINQYIRFVKMISEDEHLRVFDASALAQLIEFGVRLSGQQKKISTRFNVIADVVREANYWASKEGATVVSADHIEKAIEERIYRVKLVEDKIQEMITDGTFMIDMKGRAVGQVNGLTIYDVGEHAFGRPSRITARTSLGRSGVINVEREADLSGPTHNKGVAILTGYLRSTFAQNLPLVMDASITFEQSYGGVDGDSASSTEIYAILSSLSDIPIRQDIAVTGSVNQRGEIQPIGGVNLKIEGFYDSCKARGLTGSQGVMIPSKNAQELMLREDIIQAVKKKKFQIYAVETIEEGIEILTGVKAGWRRNGGFEANTVFGRAAEKLKEYADAWRAYEKSGAL